ncbi:hypothetical protein A2U01_0115012, partial [Trifolium medium]|nr:hypothetical protein [Trifolium medium]
CKTPEGLFFDLAYDGVEALEISEWRVFCEWGF